MNQIQLTVHRGTHEVGGTCIEVQCGSSRIILDVGLPLFNEDREAFDSSQLRRMTKDELRTNGILPNVSGLFADGSPPDAILLSHAHMDHTGLLGYSQETIPVYTSSGTSKMMLAGGVFAAQISLPKERFQEMKPEVPITIGELTITGFPVDHSIYGCLAFLIEAGGKSILYTGDLRLHGRKPGMNRSLLEVLKQKKIDALLMEGTHFGFPDGNHLNEYELEEEITKQIQQSESLVLASFSPQHVDRLVAFIRATKKTGRTFVADPYTAFILHLLQNEVKLPQPEANGLIQVYVPKAYENSSHAGREKIIKKFQHARIEMETIQKNPEKYIMIFRDSMLGDFNNEFPSKTSCLYSRWNGYLDQPGWKTVIEKLNLTDGNLSDVHTSGHILSQDIVSFVKEINPETIIPVHTFEPEQFQQHFENVTLINDGETWTIS